MLQYILRTEFTRIRAESSDGLYTNRVLFNLNYQLLTLLCAVTKDVVFHKKITYLTNISK